MRGNIRRCDKGNKEQRKCEAWKPHEEKPDEKIGGVEMRQDRGKDLREDKVAQVGSDEKRWY